MFYIGSTEKNCIIFPFTRFSPRRKYLSKDQEYMILLNSIWHGLLNEQSPQTILRRVNSYYRLGLPAQVIRMELRYISFTSVMELRYIRISILLFFILCFSLFLAVNMMQQPFNLTTCHLPLLRTCHLCLLDCSVFVVWSCFICCRMEIFYFVNLAIVLYWDRMEKGLSFGKETAFPFVCCCCNVTGFSIWKKVLNRGASWLLLKRFLQ